MKKRLLAIVLAIVLAVSMSVTAVATGSASEEPKNVIRNCYEHATVSFTDGTTESKLETMKVTLTNLSSEGGRYLLLVLKAGRDEDGKTDFTIEPDIKTDNILYIDQADDVTGVGTVVFGDDMPVYPKSMVDSVVYITGTGFANKVKIAEIKAGYVPGDANGDSVVASSDASQVLRYLVGDPDVVESMTASMLQAADANGNGQVDSGDASQILRYLVGDPDATLG